MRPRYAGRRGGLAMRPAPASPLPSAGAARQPVVARAPVAARSGLSVLRDRVRWTLVFSAFFAFSGGVVASRIAIGQPMIALGLLGVLMQTETTWIGPVPGLLALWTAWGALGYFTSPHPDAVWDPLVQLTKLCVIAFVGVNALRTRGQLRAYSVFVVVAFLVYPVRGAFLNWLTGANLVIGGRAIWNGVYGNPNDLAGIALLIISVALALSAGERDRRLKLAALAAAGFFAFLVFITQSRGALIGLGVFIVVSLRRMPKQQRLRAAVIAGVFGVIVAAFAPSSVWDRLSGLRKVTDTENLAQVDGSAEQRYEIWKVARTIIAEHPITGVGIGAYNAEHAIVSMRSQFNPIARSNRDTHSMYLNVMAETGIPGFCLFALILITTVRYADRVRRLIAPGIPNGALQIQFLELGLLAFCVAAIWASYAKLNMLYLHLVLLWATAKVYQREAVQIGIAATPRGG